ncbi:hypothetical protein Ancab_011685 [Ancistrocladus abbreviatus]
MQRDPSNPNLHRNHSLPSTGTTSSTTAAASENASKPPPSDATADANSNATLFGSPNQPIPSSSFRGPHHRRAHSEVSFRIPDDMDLSSGPFTNGGSSTEDLGSEDDLFTTYIDVDKLGGAGAGSDLRPGAGNASPPHAFPCINRVDHHNSDNGSGSGSGLRPRHRHSSSVDASSSGSRGGGGVAAAAETASIFGEIMDAKKAMPPDKLAELWAIDPKRAKRILANRQSAARSKERKARYILELERQVQTLQTEATTLSAQLTLYQRDTTGLTTENTELKLRLQAMEQQAQLRDALNEALKQEVERLRFATGEMMTPSESFDLGMHNISYNPSTFYSLARPPGAASQQSMQLPQLHQSQPDMHHLHLSNSQNHSEFLQNDHLGRLQGLDISNRGSHMVKSEGPSMSACESSSAF